MSGQTVVTTTSEVEKGVAFAEKMDAMVRQLLKLRSALFRAEGGQGNEAEVLAALESKKREFERAKDLCVVYGKHALMGDLSGFNNVVDTCMKDPNNGPILFVKAALFGKCYNKGGVVTQTVYNDELKKLVGENIYDSVEKVGGVIPQPDRPNRVMCQLQDDDSHTFSLRPPPIGTISCCHEGRWARVYTRLPKKHGLSPDRAAQFAGLDLLEFELDEELSIVPGTFRSMDNTLLYWYKSKEGSEVPSLVLIVLQEDEKKSHRQFVLTVLQETSNDEDDSGGGASTTGYRSGR